MQYLVIIITALHLSMPLTAMAQTPPKTPLSYSLAEYGVVLADTRTEAGLTTLVSAGLAHCADLVTRQQKVASATEMDIIRSPIRYAYPNL